MTETSEVKMTEEQFRELEKDLINLRDLATSLRFWDDAKIHHAELVSLRKKYNAQS